MSILLLNVALQLEAEICTVTLLEAEMDLTVFRGGVLCKYKKCCTEQLKEAPGNFRIFLVKWDGGLIFLFQGK